MATALDVAQKFADAVGFTRPSTLVANTNDDVRQLTQLLNEAGEDLASRHNWQSMTYEASFTTVATESQGTLTSIIGATQTLKKIIDDTIWDRTQRVPIMGTLSPPIWQGNKALTLTGPYSQYRVRGNQIIFNPVPTAGHTCYFEYVSECWCTDSTGATFRTALGADGDIFLVPDKLLRAGLKWMWLRAKGLGYTEEFASYEMLVASAITNERPHARLRMDDEPTRLRPGTVVPSGSWNLP